MARTVRFVLTDGDGGISNAATRTINVTAVNDAPVATITPTSFGVTEDDNYRLMPGLSVADPDAGSNELAITLSVSQGQILLSTTAGLTFTSGANSSSSMTFTGTTTDVNAALATSAYRPNPNYAGADVVTLLVDDQGNAGGGALTHSDTAGITITAVNDAPMLDNTGIASLPTITKLQTNNGGADVATIIASAGGDRITDVDSGALEGIAITSLSSGNGTWEYSINSGASWAAIGSVSNTSALLLGASDLVRFIPNGISGTTASFSFYAWDQTSGTAGTKVDASVGGGSTAFSTTSETANITVMDVNAAPVLDNSKTPVLTATSEDAGAPSGAVGSLVSSLVDFASPSGQVDNVTDVDSGAGLGIAVTGADTTNGTWFYSINNGTTWNALGAVSDSNARLLAADASTRLYFQANADYHGTMANAITFRAWDQTTGTNGGTVDSTASPTTYLDNFDVASYTNNNGTANWSTDWVETDSSGGGATTGEVAVTSSELRISPNSSGNAVYREVNLTGANSATLSFDYTNNLLSGNPTIVVRISSNGGSTYDTVASFAKTGTSISSSMSFDISSYIASNTRIQFLVSSSAGGAIYLSIDDVQISTTQTGGSSAFSTATDAASLTINPVADTPTVTGATTNEDTQSTTGLVISRNVADGAEVTHFKITGITSGTLYKNDGTTQITNGSFITFAEGNAGLKFTPTADFNGNGTFTVQGSTSNNDSGLGGGTAVATITVNAVNDAPVLDNSQTPVLTTISENAGAPSGVVGTLVSSLVDFATPSGQLDNVTDVDSGALLGIAVTAADTSNGTWFYSTSNGSTWTALGAVSDTNARLLAADAATRLYFQANANYNGTLANAITFRAWDQTSGTNGQLAESTVLDTFSVSSYASNDGTVNWGSTWSEGNDDGSASNGNVQITGGELRLDNSDGGSLENLFRKVDLSAAVSASLSFDFRTDSGVDSADAFLVEISGNNGLAWTTLETFTGITGSSAGSRTYDIGAWMAAETLVRFAVGSGYMEASEFFYLDNVQVAYADSGDSLSLATDTASITVTPVNDAPTGSVTIDNTTPAQGDLLTASNTLADVDGLGPISYQWQRGGVDIVGATGNTYTTVQADVGATITVVASYTDGQGTNESVASSPTATVTNVNDAPTGAVTIDNTTPAQGDLLTASNTLADTDGLGTITYQWQRGGVDIAGATGNTYTTVQADVGSTITVVASYTDGQGTAESVASSPTAAVTNVNDAPTGAVTIDNTTPAQGDLLTASNTLADTDGLGTITYQWQRGGVDIVGATGNTYTTVQADVGSTITVVASYTDGQGTAESVASSSTAAVTNVNDAPTGAVTIDNTTPAQGDLLTASNTLADTDGIGAISYQWQRGGVNIVGATGNTYTTVQVDVGSTITVVASYTDGQGTAESVASSPTAAVTNVNDIPTGSVTIDNTTPAQGDLLTASNTLADTDGLGTITYQWQSGGVDIAGVTGSTYTAVQTDVGSVITVVASYTDGQGTAESVASSPTAAVTNVNDAPTGSVTIDNTTPAQGDLLTASNTLADADGLGAISYQWQRGGVDIAGATANTYTTVQADVGSTITVVASYTDGQGTAESVASSPTAAVTNVNDVPTGSVTIDNTTPTQGDLLTASNTLADTDGLGTITYQWQRGGVDIVGATGNTYTTVQADVGSTITVVASYTDGQGTAESVASSPTAAVTNVNDAPTGAVTIDNTTPAQGDLLTASNTLADVDGLGTISYQWQRGGVNIAGATGNTYTTVQADVGSTMTVVASYTDGQGTAESVASSPTAAVTNVNDAPTGAVTIDNTTPAQGDLLTASNTLADVDGLGTISYQWQRGGVNIAGATGNTYTTVQADVGSTITVVASYTDGQGTAESVASSSTAAVTNVNDAPTGSVTIDNTTPAQGDLLTASNTLADNDGLGTITYQWQRGGVDIAGATGNTYTTVQADVGATITVVASYTDGQGTAESVASSPTATVTNVNDAPTGAVTIDNTTPAQGDLLTASNTLADTDGLGTISYQWQRGGVNIAGATGSTYTTVQADVGSTITVVASYTDGQGIAESVASSPTAAVTNVNDVPVGLPEITGTPTEDQILTANTSGISDADGLGAVSYQWLRDGSSIPNATTTTYTLGDADVGTQISVEVRYTDGHGTNETVASATTSPIVNINDEQTIVTNTGLTVSEGQVAAVITSALLETADVDNTPAQLTYTLISAPTSGTLRLSGSALISGNTFTQADINAGQLTYSHNDAEVFTDSFAFTVDDATGISTNGSFAVTISPVNDNDPAIAGGQLFTVSEHAIAGTSPGTVMANDVDAAGTLQNWMIIAGNSDGVFSIDPLTGSLQVTDASGLNYETTASYMLTLSVSDGVQTSAPQTVTVHVTDVNEAPVFNPAASLSVDENSAEGTTVGFLVATDEDVSDTLTYSIDSGTPDQPFNVDAATGRIFVGGASQLNFEATPGFALTVRVTDTGGLTATQTVTVILNDVNEKPTDVLLSGTSVAENSVTGTFVGTLSASDPDAGDSLTFALIDTAGNRFAVDPFTGQITVTNSSLLNFESAATHTIITRVQDTDGLIRDESFVITVSDVNEAPVAGDDLVSGEQLKKLEIPAGIVSKNDFDVDGDSLTVMLVTGPDNGTLTLNADGSFVYVPTASFSGTDQFVYHVTDGSLVSGAAKVTINILTTVTAASGQTPDTAPDDLPVGSGNPGIAADDASDTDSPAKSSTAESAGTDGQGTPGALVSLPNHSPAVEEEELLPSEAVHESVEAEVRRASDAVVIGIFLDAIPEGDFKDSNISSTLSRLSAETDMTGQNPSKFLFKPVVVANPFTTGSVFDLNQRDYLDQKAQEQQQAQIIDTVVIGSTAAISTTVSVGYVVWLLRGGSLLTTFLSSLPAWQSFDPLPVLNSFDQSKQDEDGESLASLVEGR